MRLSIFGNYKSGESEIEISKSNVVSYLTMPDQQRCQIQIIIRQRNKFSAVHISNRGTKFNTATGPVTRQLF